ncbi:MAG: uridine kinase [bacterium]|nr:uridine kinase [bacterium]
MNRETHAVYVVGIAGGTGAGKTTLAKALLEQIGTDRAVLIAHDAYYRDLGGLSVEERGRVNFDHPDALETALLADHLERLKRGETIEVPVYDFQTHTRTGDVIRVEPRSVVIVEGILILREEALRDRMDLKIFVDTPADLRLIRRLERDVRERGRTVASVTAQYLATVRPMYEQYVASSKAYADLIVPGTGDLSAARSLLAGHVEMVLEGVG